jgi:hypothetical protein
MLWSNLGMLHEFAGTPYEREEGIHEESRGDCALHGVRLVMVTTPRQSRGRADLVWTTPRENRGRAFLVWTTPPENRRRAVPPLGSGSGCAGSSSECVTTRPAHVGMLRGYLGMPRERFETPNEDGDLR